MIQWQPIQVVHVNKPAEPSTEESEYGPPETWLAGDETPDILDRYFTPMKTRKGETYWQPASAQGHRHGFRPKALVNDIINEPPTVRLGADHELWHYASHGVWLPQGDAELARRASAKLSEHYDTSTRSQIVQHTKDRFTGDEIDFTPGNPSYINCASGMLDWRTGQVEPHSPTFLSGVQIPHIWNPTADQQPWLDFLDEVLPDPQHREILQMTFGAAITTVKPPQQAVFMTGTGRNGKGVVMEILRRLISDRYVSAVPLQSLDPEKDRFAAAQLAGKVLNLCGDLPKTTLRNTELFKMITGGDSIEVQRKHQHPFNLIPLCLMVFSTNSLPRIDDDSYGVWDRIRVIPFDVTIPPEQRDPHLADYLYQSIEGVFVWAVNGARMLDEAEMQIPAVESIQLKTLKLESNPEAQFVAEFVQCIAGTKLIKKTLTDACALWLQGVFGTDDVYVKPHRNRLTNAMRAAGFSEARIPGTGERYWVDAALTVNTPAYVPNSEEL